MEKASIRLSVYGGGDSAIRDVPFSISAGDNVLSLLDTLSELKMLPKRLKAEPGYLDLLVFVDHRNVAVAPGYGAAALLGGEEVVILQAVAGG